MRDPDLYVSVADWVYSQPAGALTSTEQAVLLAMALYFNKDLECFPKAETIANRSRFSEKTVDRTWKSLRDKGILEGERPTVGGTVRFKLAVDLGQIVPGKDTESLEGQNVPKASKGHPVPAKGQSVPAKGQNVPVIPLVDVVKENEQTTQQTNGTYRDTVSLGDRKSPEGKRLAAVSLDVAVALVDELISRGLKREKYRSDAYHWQKPLRLMIGTETLGLSRLADIAREDFDLFREVLVNAARSSPDHIPFSKASTAVQPPELLQPRWNELVLASADRLAPQGVEEATDPVDLPGTSDREAARQAIEEALEAPGLEALRERVAGATLQKAGDGTTSR